MELNPPGRAIIQFRIAPRSYVDIPPRLDKDAISVYVVMKLGRVTINRIAGAIAVYLMAALLYDLVERLHQGAFMLGSRPPPLAEEGSGFFYLSVITLTSVGFGDLSPVHPLARSIVID